jgi:hypothetical protein
MSASPEQALIARFLDGIATEEEIAALSSRIESDAGFAELYTRQAKIHAHLASHSLLGGIVYPSIKSNLPPTVRGIAWLNWLALAASLGFLWLSFAMRRESDTSFAAAARHEVATLVWADGCRWSGPIQNRSGSRLATGNLQLVEGKALLQFDGGALVLLDSGTHADLQSRGRMRLNSGSVHVTTRDGLSDFVLAINDHEIVDQRSEFVAMIDPKTLSGSIEILDGSIVFQSAKQTIEKGQVVQAGKRVDVTSGMVTSMELASPKAERLVSRVRFQPDAIAASKQDLVTYEGFDYPSGIHRSESLDGGKGWLGGWRLRKEQHLRSAEEQSIDSMNLVRPQETLNSSPPQASEAWEVAAGYEVRQRILEESIDLSKDAIYYLSSFVSDGEIFPETPNRAMGFRLTFRSEKDYFRHSLCFGMAHGSDLYLSMADGLVFRSPRKLAGQGTRVWTGKVIARSSGEDSVFFRVFDDPESVPVMEPVDWDVKSESFFSDHSFEILLVSNTGPRSRSVDEIRIGKSWLSIVPPATRSNTTIHFIQ